MPTNNPDKPKPSHSSSKPATPQPQTPSDERTIELTQEEIKSFGKEGPPPVRAGRRNDKGPPKKP